MRIKVRIVTLSLVLGLLLSPAGVLSPAISADGTESNESKFLLCGYPEMVAMAKEMSATDLKDVSVAYQVAPDKTTFWIRKDEAWKQITAELKVTGNHCYVYVDEESSWDKASDLKDAWDTDIYPMETALYGNPPDIDNDDKIYVLITDIDSAGYFHPIDQDPGNSHSNAKDMIYLDESLPWSLTASQHVRSVAAHEFQHLIHYARDPSEELWVNEGCSMYTEYYIYNLHHWTVDRFEDRPDTTLTWTEYADDESEVAAQYGAAYLYTLYLAEKHGGAPTIGAIVRDGAHGTTGINNHLPAGTDFEGVFKTWVIANYLDDPNVDPLYGYTNLDLHAALTKDETYWGWGKTIDGSDATKVNLWAADYIKLKSYAPVREDIEIKFSGTASGTFESKILLIKGSDVWDFDFPEDNIFIVPGSNQYDQMAIIVPRTGGTDGDYWLRVDPKSMDVDVVLDFDRSGSMSDGKIAAAKTGAKAFIDVLEKSWEILGFTIVERDKVGLVSFSSSASLDLSLTTDFNQAKSTIDGYSAGGNTNMGDALNKSIDEISNHGRPITETIYSIIYLTDGRTNTGLTREEILAQLVPEAVDEGISIYTFGYGGDVDASFLQTLASRANGKYYFAPDAATLRRVYIELSHAIKGWDKTEEFSGYLAAGETETVGTLDIPAGLPLVKAVLTWPGSDLDLILLDPDGNPVDPGTTGILYSGDDVLPEYYKLYDPQAGTWTIQVYGKDIPGATEEYNVFVFQPGALMQVAPTNWDIEYPISRTTTFTVSEVGAMVDLTDVTFTASDLTKIDLEAARAEMALEAELESQGESISPSSAKAVAEEPKIPASSFSFTPNDFTVPAGGSKTVEATLTAPEGAPAGDYSGTITVTSNAGTATIIDVTAHISRQQIYLPLILKNYPPDTTPPAAVTDLATSNPTLDSITLNWTAPGDDCNTGTAWKYDIRYSTSPITDDNWGAAAQCVGEPAPQPAGSSETSTVNSLTPNTTHYFALKTADEVPHWSCLSNVASGTTLRPRDELIANGGFETDEAWVFGETPRPAGYTMDEAHSGARSMRLGIEPPTTDAYSWSSVRQRITIPANAASASLSFWYKPFTEDICQHSWQRFDWDDFSVDQPGRILSNENPRSWASYDWQQAFILSDDFPTPTVLATVMNINSNSGVWTNETFDLMPFAGQTVWVYFNVYNDGWGYRRTWMYLDDVSAEVCY